MQCKYSLYFCLIEKERGTQIEYHIQHKMTPQNYNQCFFKELYISQLRMEITTCCTLSCIFYLLSLVLLPAEGILVRGGKIAAIIRHRFLMELVYSVLSGSTRGLVNS